jgi:ABC-2 type transport system permease protein
VSALVRPSVAFAGRSCIMLLRAWTALIAVFVVPLVFLGSFLLLFGQSMESILQVDYLDFLVPATVTQALLFAAMGSSWSIGWDMLRGVFKRWRSLPIDPRSVLVGRVLVDLVKALVALTVLLPIVYALGFRFTGGPLDTLAFFALAFTFTAMATLGFTFVGLTVRDPLAIPAAVTSVYVTASFLSSAFTPVEQFPTWLQPIVRANPVSLVTSALRETSGSADGSVTPAVVMLAVGLVVVSVLADRALRRVMA